MYLQFPMLHTIFLFSHYPSIIVFIFRLSTSFFAVLRVFATLYYSSFLLSSTHSFRFFNLPYILSPLFVFGCLLTRNYRSFLSPLLFFNARPTKLDDILLVSRHFCLLLYFPLLVIPLCILSKFPPGVIH